MVYAEPRVLAVRVHLNSCGVYMQLSHLVNQFEKIPGAFKSQRHESAFKVLHVMRAIALISNMTFSCRCKCFYCIHLAFFHAVVRGLAVLGGLYNRNSLS